MPSKKRNKKNRMSGNGHGHGHGSSAANGNSAQRRPSSSSNWEGMPSRQPTGTLVRQNRPPVSGRQEVAQSGLGSQTPFQLPPQGDMSDSEYLRLVREINPAPIPSMPSRAGQVYGDHRDYMTREQIEQSGGSQSDSHHLTRNSPSLGITSGISQPRIILNPSTTQSGRNTGLSRSSARSDQLIDEVPYTSSSRGRAGHDNPFTSQRPKSSKARKFSDRDSNPSPPGFKRFRRIEDITDQEEGICDRNPSNNTTLRFSRRDRVHEDGSHSSQSGMTNAARNLPTNALGIMNPPEAAAMPPPRCGNILSDGYNIFNSSIMGRVAVLCERSRLRNTPEAIVTHHQLAMADDLYYQGIWRGKFLVKNEYIIEYHDPATSRPEVPDHLRTDRRLVMAHILSHGTPQWYSNINGNVLIPAAEQMNLDSGEFRDTLDLLQYFYIRVPCSPNLDRYAELVAPLHVDRSREARIENERLVGMAPGSDPATAALRIATPAEEASAEARMATRYIPRVRHNDSPSIPSNTPPTTAAPAALLPPSSTSMTSNATNPSPDYFFLDPDGNPSVLANPVAPPNLMDLGSSAFNSFSNLGVTINESTTPLPAVSAGGFDYNNFNSFTNLGVASGESVPQIPTSNSGGFNLSNLNQSTNIGVTSNQFGAPLFAFNAGESNFSNLNPPPDLGITNQIIAPTPTLNFVNFDFDNFNLPPSLDVANNSVGLLSATTGEFGTGNFNNLFTIPSVTSGESAAPRPAIESGEFYFGNSNSVSNLGMPTNAPTLPDPAAAPPIDTPTAEDNAAFMEFFEFNGGEDETSALGIPSTSAQMLSSDNTNAALDFTNSFTPSYPSTSQDLGAIPTLVGTFHAPPQSPSDMLLNTPTAHTATSLPLLIDTDTTPAAAGADSHHPTSLSTPGAPPIAPVMSIATLATPDNGSNPENSHSGENQFEWDPSVYTWPDPGHPFPGSATQNYPDDFGFNAPPDPGMLHAPTTTFTPINANLVGNSSVDVQNQWGSGNQSGASNQVGNDTPAGDDQSNFNPAFDGTLGPNDPVPDDPSDGPSESDSYSPKLDEDEGHGFSEN